jgi:acyl-CoA thioesterase FadM
MAVAGASVTVRRPLEWMDTDAAGIWHYSTVIRFAEHAELTVHDQLGVTARTFGNTPRAHVAFDFVQPVRSVTR